MGRFASDSGGGDFQQAPAGSHVARCIRIVDLGTQRSEYQGVVSHKNQVLISWELPYELYDYEDENGQKISKPFLVSKFYTNSLKDTANLYKDLVNWRGREFTADELKKFDLQSILNAPCILSVVHNDKGKAKVESVIRMTKGMEAPVAVNKPYVFWLDEFDKQVFDGLSDGIKGIIEKSPEYAALMKPKSAIQELVDMPNDIPPNPFDDDIPFMWHGAAGAGVSWRAM